MWRILASIAIVTAGLVAVQAEDLDLPAETDRIFWCASAFYWLSADADDSGDAEEAELYDLWSNRLLTRGGATLDALGYNEARKDEVVETYDVAVLGELGTEKARFKVEECPLLVSQ